ncbi:hypothetical protein CDCA_CDCA12G3419 [Cyanidium caldarium]|uniref:Cell cycle checkpoint protein RAD17 n=1 Tax=Cyanidium caldarium TaxID=2771 RepID=A0AAV9IZ97_CYACA|nr:hypothetical protein CDCA_CDCA12G3419 [Cyanidium caldarium]
MLRKRRKIAVADPAPPPPTTPSPTGQVAEDAAVQLWCEQSPPVRLNDLVTRPDKVEEVRRWLEQCWASNASATARERAPRVLSLMGPPGCGMSSLIKFVTERLLHAQLLEWVCPITLAFEADDNVAMSHRLYQSLLEYLQGFLIDVQYLALPTSTANVAGALAPLPSRSVALLDDLPMSLFEADHERARHVQQLMRHIAQHSGVPVVCIFSDERKRRLRMARTLLGDELWQSNAMKVMEMRPVAPSTMRKRLRACLLQHHCVRNAHDARLEALVEAVVRVSEGDIRFALNVLQLCRCGVTLEPVSGAIVEATTDKRSRRRRERARIATAASEPQAADSWLSQVGRNAALDIFHLMGKILHDKHARTARLPDQPSANSPEYTESVEGILERCTLDAPECIAYLHENLVDFFTDAADLSRALDALSTADMLATAWRAGVRECAAVVAARGVRAANRSPASVGFRPLRAPRRVETDAREVCRLYRSAAAARSGTDCGSGLEPRARAVLLERLPWQRAATSAFRRRSRHPTETEKGTSVDADTDPIEDFQSSHEDDILDSQLLEVCQQFEARQSQQHFVSPTDIS